MKTKLVMAVTALGMLYTSAQAQTSQTEKTKVSVNIVKNINGQVMTIDTTFTSKEEAEAYLKKNNIGGDVDLNMTEKEFAESNKTPGKTHIIKIDGKTNGGSGTTAKQGSCGKTMVWSHSSDTSITSNQEVDVMIEDNGTVIINTGDGKDPKIVKMCLPDSITKEMLIDETTTNDGKTKTIKTVKIIVIKKIDVSDLSDNERKAMPKVVAGSEKNKITDLKIGAESGRLNINFNSTGRDPVTISIFDSNGKAVMSEKEAANEGAFTKEMLVNTLPTGLYFIRVEQGQKAETKKIVITESNR